jgi:hypothetical protein
MALSIAALALTVITVARLVISLSTPRALALWTVKLLMGRVHHQAPAANMQGTLASRVLAKLLTPTMLLLMELLPNLIRAMLVAVPASVVRAIAGKVLLRATVPAAIQGALANKMAYIAAVAASLLRHIFAFRWN